MGRRIADQTTKIKYFDKDLELDSDSDLTASGAATFTGTVTLPATVATKRTVTAKTASYQVLAAETGTVFTNTGDTDAITFTLPVVTSTGCEYWFYCVAAFDFAVTAAADKMVTFNCNLATSVKLGTGSEQIGNGFYAVSDGLKWLVFPMAEETATITVA